MNLPPDGAMRNMDDFVNYCKFALCKKVGRLMLDPIWDSYTDEAIIVEYYAHTFAERPKELARFEEDLGIHEGVGTVDEFAKWAEEQEAKNKEVLKEDFKDNISFSPELGD